ncbi:MAG TPA: M1 family metallopeptidase [Balneolaceae bacterium]|nr:M1 family metallopeptidase [Balneolaceae bacterium]
MKKFYPYIHLFIWAMVSVLIAQPVFGQSTGTKNNQTPGLYEPRGVKEAYAAGTRSPDGKPGPNYWENHGKYKITIMANPPDRTIRGTEQIVYRNESPNPLPMLIVKLFLNVHRPTATRGTPGGNHMPKTYLNTGIHVDSLAIDGTAQPWREIPYFVTWQPIRLPTPLQPGDSIRIHFSWHYKIAPAKLQRGASQEGIIDPGTYYLAYFYPRVAVYDDYQGWDTTPYTLAQNFYSDFNDYDVTVRVPADYVVWGTGKLTNAADVLSSSALGRYRASFTSDTPLHIATKKQMTTGKITKGNGMNSWHFTAHNIPDVAFGLSNHYNWDGASVIVDSTTERRASVQSAYNDTAADFHRMVHIGRHALNWLSQRWPGVPYPYSKMTIFQGGSGMEYPMMANDESLKNFSLSRSQAEHEISHSYMPFYMGIDETRYGFMDEGWATTFEYLIGRKDLGISKEDSLFLKMRVNIWAHGLTVMPGLKPSPIANLPIITPGDALSSPGFSGAGLSFNEYGKAALGYLAMKDLLGDAIFKKCLQAYMDRWNSKHPSPWDFFYTFDDVSGQNLDWFWRNWFFSHNYIDLAVSDVSKTTKGYAIELNNVGGMDAPVDLKLRFANGNTRIVHKTPAIWKSNQKHATVHIKTNGNLTSLSLDGGIWEDADPSDNNWKAD